MRILSVSLEPAPLAKAAGRPSLSPELLAATGARYSRNNDGLDAILGMIDHNDPEGSVDRIFKMVDYGHASILDLAPVAIFLDGVSLWLAYHIFSLCATIGGQESSTRYVKLDADGVLHEACEMYFSGVIDPKLAGIPEKDRRRWNEMIKESFNQYEALIELWEQIYATDPSVSRIPQELLDAAAGKDDKLTAVIAQAKRQFKLGQNLHALPVVELAERVATASARKAALAVARMKRNFIFDRARYALPAAALTNIMGVMPARGWVKLVRILLSSPQQEAIEAGKQLAAELGLNVPRCVKHATAAKHTTDQVLVELQGAQYNAFHARQKPLGIAGDRCFLEARSPSAAARFYGEDVYPNNTLGTPEIDLKHHENRYAPVGPNFRRTSVHFGWDEMAFAEQRDFNRHRTGEKFSDLCPTAVYFGEDLIPLNIDLSEEQQAVVANVRAFLLERATFAREMLAGGEWTYIYWTHLGTCYRFEHLTTANHFIYEMELRTGLGTHPRYASQMRAVSELWFERFPTTRPLIQIGTAEPE